MIAILAATADVTAYEVRRWLRAWGYAVVLIDDDDPIVELTVELGAATDDAYLRARSGRAIRLTEVAAFWYRRGGLRLDPALLGTAGETGDSGDSGDPGDPGDPRASARAREWSAMREFFMERLAAKPGLGSWAAELRCTKLQQLAAARAVGLAIPETVVTSERARLVEAVDGWGAAIHKGVALGVLAEEEAAGEVLATSTRPLERAALERAPARLFPRLAQARLDKRVELRVFFLRGELWALAILPRRPQAAALDVRLGDLDADYRLLPYALPEEVAARLRRLMARLQLDTGSIDLIVDRDGAHTFLEVNPSGQVDWLARALGAPIERRIAEELAALAGPPRPSSCPRRPGERGRSGDDASINEPRRRGAEPEAPAPHSAARRDEDGSFVEAPHRFAWVEGQRVLVRPLDKPILRRFPGGRRAPAAATGGGRASLASTDTEGRGVVALAANVALVDGCGGPLLYDLQRGRAFRPPAALADALMTAGPGGALRDGAAAESSSSSSSSTSALGRGIAAAEAAGLLVRVAAPERFPARATRWESPAAITNAVIDVDAASEHDFSAIFRELGDCGCEHALIRVDREEPLALVDRLHAAIEGGPPLVLEWWIPRRPEVTPSALRERVARWPRIAAVVVFGAPAEEVGEWLRTRSGVGNVVATAEVLDLDATPTADPAAMFVRDALFAESLRHHPLFHRKLAIDRRGLLRNAPHLRRDFGRFGARPLAEVVRAPDFIALGEIHRGQIVDCRACPLRYACMDGRAPIVDRRGEYRLESPCEHGPGAPPTRRLRVSA
ncbi:MAG: hypothetical protein KC486_18595 [Myxococcales bacterium]|nr:hypothetical protein [Myxococcales bacterium]